MCTAYKLYAMVVVLGRMTGPINTTMGVMDMLLVPSSATETGILAIRNH